MPDIETIVQCLWTASERANAAVRQTEQPGEMWLKRFQEEFVGLLEDEDA